MKWILIVLGLIGGMVALVALIGAMLPRDHVATMTATIPAPPDSVWATLTDVNAYPVWREDVQSVEVISKSPLSWRENSKQGLITLAVESSERPRRMVVRIQDQGLPFGGAWEYQVAADSSDPAKSRVTITERGWVSNPVFRFVSKFILGHHATLDSYLRALGRKFGADVAPRRV